jgi:antitoxin PrlF
MKMEKRNKKEVLSVPATETKSCCRVEALISIDERGQMVLPKELRERAKIRAGDKLAVITWDKGGEVCCMTLIKADCLADHVRDFLGPVLAGISAT